MTRRMGKALGLVVALMALLFWLMRRLDGDASAQMIVSVIYVVAVVAVLRWARRRPLR